MQYMHCTTCTSLVQVNNTGTCLGCQRGFAGLLQEDAYVKVCKRDDFEERELRTRKKEIEDAVQESEAKSLPAQKQARNGKGVGKRNSKRKKATKKS